MNRNNYCALFPFLLLLLAPIRLIGLYQGIPDGLNPDETIVVHRALYFTSGDLNPHFFYYPSFSMYTTSAAIGVKVAFMTAAGSVHSIRDIKALFAHDPSFVYQAARVGVAVFGLLSVVTLYGWGRTFIGDLPAFLAALLALLAPTLTEQAHYAKPDAQMAWLALLAFLASCSAYQRMSFRWLVMSAGFCGLAFSTKYNAIPLICPIIIIFVTLYLKQSWRFGALTRNSFILLAAFWIAFFVGTPYAAVDFHTFFAQLGSIKAYTAGAGSLPMTLPHFVYNMRDVWNGALGGTALGSCYLIGIGFALMTLNRYAQLGFASVLVFLIFVARQSMAYTRYFEPVLPILIFSVVAGIEGCSQEASRKGVRVAACLLSLTLIGLSALKSAQLIREFRKPYGLELAKSWILDHCPDGSKILVDAGSPSLPLTRDALSELLQKATASGNIKGALFRLNLDYYDSSQKHFDVYISSQAIMTLPPDLLQKGRSVQRLQPIDDGLSPLFKKGFKYILTSSSEEHLYIAPAAAAFPKFRRYYESLNADPRVNRVFDSAATGAAGPRVCIYELH